MPMSGELETEPDPEPVLVTVSLRSAVNVAVTARAWSIVTWHGFVVPAQSPLQPVKTDPAAGVAVRVMSESSGKSCMQVAPQSIPAGLLPTPPLPLPSLVIVSVCVGSNVKTAVTARAWSIVTEHGLVVPVQSPVQWSKVDPNAGVAVSVTIVPSGKACVHVAPQSIPTGLLPTVPVPVLLLDTFRSWVGFRPKVAVTDRA